MSVKNDAQAVVGRVPVVMPAMSVVSGMWRVTSGIMVMAMMPFPMPAMTMTLLPMPAMTMSFRPVRIVPVLPFIAVGPGMNPVSTPFGAVVVTFVPVIGAWPVVSATAFALG